MLDSKNQTINLKKILMELGNSLVINHGYDPATTQAVEGDPMQHFVDVLDTSTTLLSLVTEWLNDTNFPERREELEKLGVEWPIVKG